MPCAASVVNTCCCAAYACVVHDRSCASVAYLTFASRCATEGVCRTTIIRCPDGTAERGSPTSPRQLTACCCAVAFRPRATTVTPSTIVRIATPSRRTLRRGMCIKGKVVGVRDGMGVPARGGDHRRVVGAERKGGERRVRECGAQLGIG